MQPLRGATRLAFTGFFASHILFTIVIDGQIVAKAWYPTLLQDFLEWYVTTFQDPLVRPPSPLWLQSLVVVELLFQLPFFCVACHYLSRSTATRYPDWFRWTCLTYGTQAATSLVPILTTLATHEQLLPRQRGLLVALYLPYLIFPLWIWYLAVSDAVATPTEPADLKPKLW